MWQVVPLVVVGLTLACKTADPPAAARPAESVKEEPAPAEPVMADTRIRVDITYCIP